MAARRRATIIPENAELSTVQAAEVLKVSQLFLIKLLEAPECVRLPAPALNLAARQPLGVQGALAAGPGRTPAPPGQGAAPTVDEAAVEAWERFFRESGGRNRSMGLGEVMMASARDAWTGGDI